MYIYHIVRKPTHVLDFALTLLLNHLILTTYYSASLPSSLFFWLTVIGGAAATVIFAEQLCVRREMRDGLVSILKDSDGRRSNETEEGRIFALPPSTLFGGVDRSEGQNGDAIEMKGRRYG